MNDRFVVHCVKCNHQWAVCRQPVDLDVFINLAKNAACPACGAKGRDVRVGPSLGMAFIGVKACGCVVAATVDDGSEQVSKDVTAFAQDGLRIERVKSSEVARRFRACTHGKQGVLTAVAGREQDPG